MGNCRISAEYFMNPIFGYTSVLIFWVLKLGGALKNVIALAAGQQMDWDTVTIQKWLANHPRIARISRLGIAMEPGKYLLRAVSRYQEV